MNRRKMLSLLGISPALLASLPAEAQEAKTGAKATVAKSSTAQLKVEGLNPKGTPPPIQLIPMAPRLDSLDGKTVWLVDTGFDGGGYLLQQIQLWFKTNMPTDRKSTRLNSSHLVISYAVFCLKKKNIR